MASLGHSSRILRAVAQSVVGFSPRAGSAVPPEEDHVLESPDRPRTSPREFVKKTHSEVGPTTTPPSDHAPLANNGRTCCPKRRRRSVDPATV